MNCTYYSKHVSLGKQFLKTFIISCTHNTALGNKGLLKEFIDQGTYTSKHHQIKLYQ